MLDVWLSCALLICVIVIFILLGLLRGSDKGKTTQVTTASDSTKTSQTTFTTFSSCWRWNERRFDRSWDCRLQDVAVKHDKEIYVVSQDGDLFCEKKGTKSFHLFQPFACEKALHGVKVRSIACGRHHCIALSSQGLAYSWGSNKSGQLGHGVGKETGSSSAMADYDNRFPRIICDLLSFNVTQAACGAQHSLCVTENGSAFSWGDGSQGALGHLDQKVWDRPKRILTFPTWSERPNRGPFHDRKIVQVACGSNHSVALDSRGFVFCFGKSSHNECGEVQKPNQQEFVPCPIQLCGMEECLSGDSLVSICCGKQFSLARSNMGRVYGWGGLKNLLGPKPRRIDQGRFVSVIACGDNFAAGFCNEEEDMSIRPTSFCFWGVEEEMKPFPSTASAHIEGLPMLGCGSRGLFVYIENHKDWKTQDHQRPAEEQMGKLEEMKKDPALVKQEMERELKRVQIRKKWELKILANWNVKRNSQTLKTLLWKDGIPSYLRPVIWPLAIGNKLRITKDVYEIFCETKNNDEENVYLITADLPRTLPTLGFFEKRGPLSQRLHNVLKTFAAFRPDLGYIQAMSYLAAMFCVNTEDEFTCFKCLANVLMSEHFFAFYRLNHDLMDKYYGIFDQAMQENPATAEIASQLTLHSINGHLYLLNWWQTLYLKVLPFPTACRICDCFLLEGTEVIVKTALAIVKIFKPYLVNTTFEDCIKLLSCSPGQEEIWKTEINEERLFATIAEMKLSSKLIEQLNQLKEQVR